MISQNFFRTKSLTAFHTFDNFQRENLSKIFFPDKAKNLDEFPLHVMLPGSKGQNFIYNQQGEDAGSLALWVETIAGQMNASLIYVSCDAENLTSWLAISRKLSSEGRLDILVDAPDYLWEIMNERPNLYCYRVVEECLCAPLPPGYSIYEQVLILPLDGACWLWLAITTFISAILWRFLEGPGSQWKFLFCIYSLFVGKFVDAPA